MQTHSFVFCGQLAAVRDHGTAAELMRRADHIVRKTVSRRTTRCVVGIDGWPVLPTGEISGNLRRAIQISRESSTVRVISELQWISEFVPDANVCFTGPGLVQIAGLTARRFRAVGKAGCLSRPDYSSGIPEFGFLDARRLTHIGRLIGQGVRLTVIKRALLQMSHVVPDARVALLSLTLDGTAMPHRGLAALRRRTQGGRLVDLNGNLTFDWFTECSPFNNFAVSTFDRKPDLFAVGWAAEQRGDLDEAISAYEACLVEEFETQAAFNLASSLYQSGEYLAAAQRFLQIIEHDPRNADSWNNLGACRWQLGHLEKARAAFEQAISCDRGMSRATENLRRLNSVLAGKLQFAVIASDSDDVSRSNSSARIAPANTFAG